MSPKTKELYDVLAETYILHNSDDSVKDPDYITGKNVGGSSDLDTDCSTNSVSIITADVVIHNVCTEIVTKTTDPKNRLAKSLKKLLDQIIYLKQST